jgi:hypothetical protein
MAWVPGAVLLMAGSVRAQEALRSYLEVDAAIAPQPGLQPNLPVMLRPDRSHLGPVDFTLGIYSGVKFDDNINLVQDQPDADVIISAGLDLDLAWQATDSSLLKFAAKIGYAKYLEHSVHDALELSPDSALSWDIGFADGGFTFFDQFSYSRQVITEPAVSGIASLPIFSNTVGARARWQPDKWSFEITLSHEDLLSDADTFQYLDRSSQYALVRVARRFAEETRAGFEASAGVTDYKLPIQPDSTSYSVGPFAEWQVTKFLRTTIRGGPTFYKFDSQSSAGGANNLGSYYLGWNLDYQMTDYVRHQIDIERDVRLGVNEGNKYIEQFTANYNVQWAITQQCGLGFGLVYEQGSQPLTNFFFPVTENFDRIGLNPSVSWHLTQKLFASLSYWHWSRTSNLPGRGYAENSLALGFNFTF